MNKILLFAVMLFTAVCAAQSVEGDWYFVYRNNIRHFKITKDTLYYYDASDGFTSLDSLTTNKIDRQKDIIVKRETAGNKLVYHTRKINNSDTKALTELTLELREGKYPQLMVTIMDEKDKNETTTSLPLRFITFNELKSYASLKSVTYMDEKEFTAFAKDIITIKKTYNKNAPGFRNYLLSEVKYILAAMGYNPLLSMNELEDKLINRYADNPNTKALVEQMSK